MKRDNKTVLGVIGVLLTLFGLIFTIPVVLNKQYILLPFTAISVIVGVIIIASAFSD